MHCELDGKDIDTLTEPKVLTDFRCVDKDGERSLTANSDITFFNQDGELQHNLLIKGNNLLALYTLRERLAGQVKLIYIDPPYNTNNDSFCYNDNFNHSSWLVFMKNRLEVARELLRDDGVIFVQIDDNEQAYLKVLMDEIFGRDNFRSQIVWLRSSSGKVASRTLPQDTDYILWYSKSEHYEFHHVYKPLAAATKKMYNKDDQDGRGKYRLFPLQAPGDVGQGAMYDFIDNDGKVWKPPVKGWRIQQSELKALDDDGRLYKSGTSLSAKAYWQERAREDKIANNTWEDIADSPELSSFWRDIANLQGANREKINFTGQKPEKLIKRIIEMTTSENDIVLDFCVGTGTTSAVAHKMGRRWIGIEQMDYIEELTKKRMQQVIAGEQIGISKSINWSGGGSFIYFELKKYNQEYIDRIDNATSIGELEKVYVDIRNNAFLQFWFERTCFEKETGFRELNLNDRKDKLIQVLDLNQLYLNYADMDDARHKVTDDEKTLTNKFYGTKEN